MPIPNEAQATYLDQAEIDTGDVAIWERVAAGYWIVSGGAVTAQGSPDGTVAVASGTARVAGVNKTISAGNVSVISGSANPDSSTATAADATQARFSLITINASSQLGVIHGTPAGLSPNNDGSYLAVFPTVAGTILAAVFIPPAATVVTTSMISDKRITGSVNALADWGAKGALQVGLSSSTGTAFTVGANDTILMADPAQTEGVKWVASATPVTQAFNDAAAAGTSDDFARGSHVHGMPAGVLANGGGVENVVTGGNTGTAQTISLTSGNLVTYTVNGNCTFTMPSGLTSGKVISFTTILTDSGGPRTITFTGVKWNAGADPTAMSAASAIDIYTFMTIDGGTTWYGFKAGTGMAT